jgi:prefoldin subunit 5
MSTENSSLDEFKKVLKRQELARAKISARFAMVTAIISSMGVALVAGQLFDIFETHLPSRTRQVTQAEMAALRNHIKELKKQSDEYKEYSNAIKQASQGSIPINFPAHVGVDLKRIDSRLASLEAAILESPERALAIPLLRKELEESSKRDDQYKVIIRAEIDRLYEQQKWILGGIGTVLLAVAGGAITILMRSFSKGKSVVDV